MPGPWAGGPPPFAPFIGGFMFLLFLLVAVTAFFLIRRGSFGPPPVWLAARGFGPSAPEAEAKKILADRFAQGEIGAEEFMERAAVLNWTPGANQEPVGPKKKRR